jgi:hypothetical protein
MRPFFIKTTLFIAFLLLPFYAYPHNPVYRTDGSGSSFSKPFNQKVKCIYSSFYIPVSTRDILEYKESKEVEVDSNLNTGVSHIQDCNDRGPGTKVISCSGNDFAYSYTDEYGRYDINGTLSPKGDKIITCSVKYNGSMGTKSENISVNFNSIPGKRFHAKKFCFDMAYGDKKESQISSLNFTLIDDNPGMKKTSSLIKRLGTEMQNCQITFEFE